MPLPGWYPVQQRLDCRTISRADADMVQTDGTARVDQHVSATLVYVPSRFCDLLPLDDLLQVSPPGFRTPNIPKGSGKHAVVSVRLAGIIDKERPGQRCIINIFLREIPGLECDQDDLHVPLMEFLLPVTQLRDVRPAGKSTEVAMEHHQQPASPVVFEKVGFSAAVPKGERYGRFPRQDAHGWLRSDGRTCVRSDGPDAPFRTCSATSRTVPRRISASCRAPPC